MGKIDLDKLICSLAKQHKGMPKVWENALSEQGLEYNYTTNSLHPIMPYTGYVRSFYKIGDYVVSIDDYVYKVIDVYEDIDKITNETKTKYKLSDIDAPVSEDKLVNVEDFDKASHLWSIDDAMYGETVYLKDDNDGYWLVMVDSVVYGNLYALHSYSFITKEHYGGETDDNLWGPVSSIQQVCPASVSQRRVLLDIIEKSKSGTYRPAVTNFNSLEKEKSEPIISYQGKENTWNSATDFIPTDDEALASHKFSIGEWVTDGNRILRIGCICNEEPLYYFDEKNFGSQYDTIEHVDANYHLWGIDDAKKDDFLSCSGRDKIIIKFESKEDLPLLTMVRSNAHVLFTMRGEDVKVNFSTGKCAWSDMYHPLSDWKPATSEEKKTLENILSSISQVAKKEKTANNEKSK